MERYRKNLCDLVIFPPAIFTIRDLDAFSCVCATLRYKEPMSLHIRMDDQNIDLKPATLEHVRELSEQLRELYENACEIKREFGTDLPFDDEEDEEADG